MLEHRPTSSFVKHTDMCDWITGRAQ